MGRDSKYVSLIGLIVIQLLTVFTEICLGLGFLIFRLLADLGAIHKGRPHREGGGG